MAPELRRTLGFRDLVLFYLATTLSLRWIATAAAAGPSALIIWVFAALGLFVPLVFTVMQDELMPKPRLPFPVPTLPALLTSMLVFVALMKRTVAVLLLPTPVTSSSLSSHAPARIKSGSSAAIARER